MPSPPLPAQRNKPIRVGKELHSPQSQWQPPQMHRGPRVPPYSSNAARSGQSVRAALARGQPGGAYEPFNVAPPPGYRPPARRQSLASTYSDTVESGGYYKEKQGYGEWDNNDDADDALHNASSDWGCDPCSGRGWANMIGLFIIFVTLIGLFVALPVVTYFRRTKLSTLGGADFGLGGINATGQIPLITQMRGLIDSDTPKSAYSRTGFDGQAYSLVFSDEFSRDGRTFWPGDDPFWEAVDLHYYATNDLEWYDPDAVTTRNGSLVITISRQSIHNLNYRSGMITSWNKLCMTGGYFEVSISLPGVSTVPGLWPGAWTMGNLGRAGYGATTDGTWPYSYNTCDVGTMPNQTNVDGRTPAAALTSGANNGELSYLPGQRLSACTCPSSSSEHPGPSVNVGRGAPEIDILEAQVSGRRVGGVSQSMQIAPYDAGYNISQAAPNVAIANPANTVINTYRGGVYQQAVSAVTNTNPAAYTGSSGQFASYGFEYFPGTSNGYITWQANGQQSWTIRAPAIGPNAVSQVGQRLISEEPMYMILNLGLSNSFQAIDLTNLRFPAEMHVDYVRMYQRTGSQNIGCDPSARPTANYINKHQNAYTVANLTTWEQAGYAFPKNRLTNGGTC